MPQLSHKPVNRRPSGQRSPATLASTLGNVILDQLHLALSDQSHQWAINYLMVESGLDVFLNTFYPAIQELGWEKAFSKVFGKSIDEFYTDFDQFIGQSHDDLLQFIISERVDSW
jgi:hypothetical protein